MIDDIRPKRAETSDIANAVLDGTDAVMLSGETTIGHHPIDVCTAMGKICEVTEEYASFDYIDEEKKLNDITTAIAEGVEIGDGCILHPHVTIGKNAAIGNNTEIYSNAVVYHDCKVGNNCILHAGCVIGADGFGFQPTEKGYEKIPQIGIAIIEDDVEIGANTCIDRAVMGATIVHKGVKLDNLVQIAHNNEIGSHTVMSAQVGIAGSTKVGEWCMFGGQVGIAGHATIASRTMAGAQAGIPNSVKKEGMAIQGTPAIEGRNFWKSSAVFKKLPEMWAEMNQMKKEIKALKEQIELEKAKTEL